MATEIHAHWSQELRLMGDKYHRGFKGLKQAIKLEFKLKQYDKVWNP